MMDAGVFFTDLEDTPIPLEERWQTRTFANPGAGVQPSAFVVPGGFYMMLVSAFCVLTTDANAANRTMHVNVLDPDGNQFTQWASGVNIAASATANFTAGLNLSIVAASPGGIAMIAISPFMLFPGWQVRWRCVNQQVGDTITQQRFLFLCRPHTTTARRVAEPPRPGDDYDRYDNIYA